VFDLDSIRVLVALAFALLLFMHRLEASKFSVAEYAERQSDGRQASLLQRVGWYITGLALVTGVLLIHPAAGPDLGLELGDRRTALVDGFAFGVIGVAQAAAFALLRYRRLRFPPAWTYPVAVVNAVVTAFLDEATFRGVILGGLLIMGIPDTTANVVQALLYTLATRTGAPGRDRYVFIMTIVLGLAAGWVTTATGAIGAAFLGHAITRVAFFICTGHAGQPAPPGHEIEDSWEFRRPPAGWRPADGAEVAPRAGRER
jgi:membrane protease YdiL (CAAX protease family)